MVTEEQVRESLKEVLVPEVMRSLVKLNLVREVMVSYQRLSYAMKEI